MSEATLDSQVTEPALPTRIWRAVQAGFGWVLIAVGLPLALLPLHLGLPLLIFGMILVLRASTRARRKFIEEQHKRPKLVFPIRRLLRREPEVMPVAWQQVLRAERTFLPSRWRFAKTLRRQLFGRRRKGRGFTRPQG